MLRFTAMSVVLAAGALIAAPVPPVGDAKALVAGLSDPSAKVRDEAAAELKNCADALPWLRRAARSTDKDTAKRAAALLEPHEKKRQETVSKAIDASIRDGQIDLVMEWHHYWQPRYEEELWKVGPRATKAGLDLYVKSCPKQAWERFEKRLARFELMDTKVHNGPYTDQFGASKAAWLIRTDRLDGRAHVSATIGFASVDGPANLIDGDGRHLILGPVQGSVNCGFVACDGGIGDRNGNLQSRRSVIVCRGNVKVDECFDTVLLVVGNIDLQRATDSSIQNSVIRATGEIRLWKNANPANCTIQAHVQDATAPYKFFDLSDVGLSVVADKEGVIVTDVKADTPIGNCGLAKGDRIRAIDDVRFESPDDFRKKLRRAMVRQGDCLLTVVRDGKTVDLPVFFPTPK